MNDYKNITILSDESATQHDPFRRIVYSYDGDSSGGSTIKIYKKQKAYYFDDFEMRRYIFYRYVLPRLKSPYRENKPQINKTIIVRSAKYIGNQKILEFEVDGKIELIPLDDDEEDRQFWDMPPLAVYNILRGGN